MSARDGVRRRDPLARRAARHRRQRARRRARGGGLRRVLRRHLRHRRPHRAADAGPLGAHVHRRVAVRPRRRAHRAAAVLASAVATSVMLGFRNAFYGLSLAPVLRVPRPAARSSPRSSRSTSRRRWRSAARSSTTTAAPRGSPSGRPGLSVFVFWNLATLAGAVGASALGDPKLWGLDAAIPAGFIALVWPRLHDRRAWTIGLVAAAVALVAHAVPAPRRPGAADLRRRRRRRSARRTQAGRRVSATWWAVIVATLGCYAAKLARAVGARSASSSDRSSARSPTRCRSRCSWRSSPCRRSRSGQTLVVDARVAGLGRGRRGAPAAGAVPRRRRRRGSDRRGVPAAGVGGMSDLDLVWRRPMVSRDVDGAAPRLDAARAVLRPLLRRGGGGRRGGAAPRRGRPRPPRDRRRVLPHGVLRHLVGVDERHLVRVGVRQRRRALPGLDLRGHRRCPRCSRPGSRGPSTTTTSSS